MASIGTPTVTGERSYSVSCSGLEEGKNYRLYGLKAGQTVSNGYSSFSANATASGSARFSCWVSEGDTVAVVSKLVLTDINKNILAERSVSMSYTPSVTTPSTPSSISYSTSINSYNSTRITWGSVSGATSYVLERSINGGSFSQVYSGTATSYTDYGLNSSTTRVQYRVKAVNSGGSSSYKTGSSATVYYSKPNVAPIVMGICRDINWKNP